MDKTIVLSKVLENKPVENNLIHKKINEEESSHVLKWEWLKV